VFSKALSIEVCNAAIISEIEMLWGFLIPLFLKNVGNLIQESGKSKKCKGGGKALPVSCDTLRTVGCTMVFAGQPLPPLLLSDSNPSSEFVTFHDLNSC